MQCITLSNTDLLVSRLGFGTGALHHLSLNSDRIKLLQEAFDNGITHFDTARMYGDGMAEHSLGKFLTGKMRQRVTLASKVGIPARPMMENFPYLMYAVRGTGGFLRKVKLQQFQRSQRDFSEKQAELSLNKSLRALKTDWLDILFIHEPSEIDIPAIENLSTWLLHQKSSGRVRYLGLSGYAEICLKFHCAFPGLFDILQVEDSIENCEADVLINAGFTLQSTFGYLRLEKARNSTNESVHFMANNVIKLALKRNSDGIVLISTRKLKRIHELVRLV